ncbi:hypothetical protein KC318_g8882 [Hortaea werneckii]|uniref:Uncharacterized protein n=1 Tax=Hortaea werneckii TaxID=91943 RepID=A0A3M7BIZ6_HORWE|nr:hypothetical protein KC334_g6310 [Hortaea werneckii]KAI7662401.1 hypothetical protein KC318_g8882 [Hortaea werneckii]RMY20987.1 hypothetical protein D0867_03605 [Hortaea werneckii]RMY39802.1 hypothetical protein D0866_01687 [Hortaea werneckii]
MPADVELNAMASPAGQQDSTTCDRGETSSMNVTCDQSADLNETPQTHYHETFRTQSVPTKTGDEVDSGAQHDEERPQTAGTSHSGTTNLDEEDASFLEIVTHRGTTKDAAGNPQPVTNDQPLFTGPPQTSSNESGQAFSFAPAIPQQLNMTGTRKGFAAVMNSHTSATNEEGQRVPQLTLVHGMHPLMAEACSKEGALARKATGKPSQRPEKSSQTTSQQDSQSQLSFDSDITNAMANYQNCLSHQTDNNSVRPGNGLSHRPQDDVGDLHGITPANRLDLVTVKDQGEELQALSERLPTGKRTKAKLAEHSDAFFHMQPPGSTESTAFLQAETKLPGSNSLHKTSSGDNEPRTDAGARVAVNQSPTMEQHVEQCDGDSPIPSRSGQQATSRNTAKRRPRSKKPKMTPPVRNGGQSDQSNSDIEDYLQVFGYKMHVKKQEAARKHAAERDALLAELQYEIEAKSALQEELRSASADRTSLITSIEQQKTRIKTLEHKVSRLKTFLDGLGNDMDALKKESGTTRRRSERLIQEGEERKAEQHVLLEQLSDCAEKSAQLQSSALKACQETQSELKMAQQQNNYLEQQLNEKVGLLTEERDRRVQQEARSVSDAGSNQAVLSALKANHDALLDQLYLIRTLVEDGESDRKSTDLVEKVLAAIQALTSQQSANADDLLSMTDDMQSLSNEVTSFIELASKGKSIGQPDVDSLRDHLDEALQRMKDHFDLRKEMAKHAARNEEGTVALQEKLKNIDMRLQERDLQRAADETAKEQLREQIHRLQTRIESLQQSPLSTATSDTPFTKARDELEVKGRALDAANDKLLSIQQELRTLRETNNDLQEQKRSLLNDVAEAERRVATADAEKRSVEIKYKDDAEKLRTDVSIHLQNAISKNKMQSENILRNLTSQRDELTQKIKHLQREVEAARASLVQFQQESTERTAEQARHLRAMEEQAETSQHEIDSLRTRLAEQHDQTEDDDAIKQHISQLSEQLNFAKTEQRAALEQKGLLAAKVESIQHDLMQTQCAKEEAEERALQLSGEKSGQLEQLQIRVKELENDLKQAKTKLQHQRKIFEDKLASEESSREGSPKALQLNIQEKQVDNEHYKEKLPQAQAELEKALAGERNHHGHMIAQRSAEDLNSQMTTSEIMADHQHPHSETTQPKQPLSRNSELSQSPSFCPAFGVANTEDGITPTATNKENQPPRPRKKVDRSTNTITDADPLPVPDILRRSESRVSEWQKTEIIRHEPEADPGQSRCSHFQTRSLLGFKSRSSDTHGKRPVTAAISESDEMLDRTQATEKLPWFSEFNDSNGLSQATRAEAKSSAVPDSPVNDTGLLVNVLSDLHSPRNSRGQMANDTSTAQPEGFAIHEDLQQGDPSRGEKSAESRGALRDSPAWSRAPADKDNFRKVYPRPNSALKLVRHDDNGEPGPAFAGMEPKSMMPVSERSASKFGMTQARLESAVYHPKSQRIPTANSAKSSSPDYVAEAGARMHKTYHLESVLDSTKLDTFRSQSKRLPDPRLVGREAQQAKKRKSSGSVLEGYESERKKRKTQEPAPTPTRPQRRSSRRTVAQESSARNATPLPEAYSYKDTGALNKPSRRRAPATNPTERRRRGSKKNNEMAAYLKDALSR